MSFRKKHIVIGSQETAVGQTQKPWADGIRPSPVDGRLTTSTGTASLDGALGGHLGQSLGTSLLVEETGTTDFASVLLRYYASEGLVQGHCVHVLGLSDAWKQDLPGLRRAGATGLQQASSTANAGGKIKIAWRYEALGNAGPGSSSR